MQEQEILTVIDSLYATFLRDDLNAVIDLVHVVVRELVGNSLLYTYGSMHTTDPRILAQFPTGND